LDENETDDGQAVVLTTNNTLRWQIDHNEHKNAKEKMKLASRLLDAWISDGIKIEIEDFQQDITRTFICDCVSLFDKFVSFFGVCAILDLDFNISSWITVNL
jgi:hypothetical protein